eukprot:TRINITY_DN2496_c0_g1_i7.p1 TRINITY_DN2496_c0_g1~~TRINITY_DN2496_c0_g1_i7.p1  ORF type:complete len:103 (-),score=15.68 TRINITY_DN2496_c0_g1_i7:104-412(-)
MIICIYNEFLLVLSFIVVMLINILEIKEKHLDVVGWIIIFSIVVALALTWANSLIVLIKDLLAKVRKFLAKKKRRAETEPKKENHTEKKAATECSSLKQCTT